MTLVYHRCLWQVSAEFIGLETILVAPTTWQSFHKVKGKPAYMTAASKITGRDMEENEAAAVLIAAYVRETQ